MSGINSTTFNSLGSLHAHLWWDVWLSLPQQTLDEVGDVPASDGNVLDAASNDIPVSLEKRDKLKGKKK